MKNEPDKPCIIIISFELILFVRFIHFYYGKTHCTTRTRTNTTASVFHCRLTRVSLRETSRSFSRSAGIRWATNTVVFGDNEVLFRKYKTPFGFSVF